MSTFNENDHRRNGLIGGRFSAKENSLPDAVLSPQTGVYDKSECEEDRFATRNPAVNRDSVTDLLEFEHGGLRVVINQRRTWVQAHSVIVNFDVVDSSGQKVGYGVRDIAHMGEDSFGEWHADHRSLTLDESVQGLGFSTAFNQHLFKQYKTFPAQITQVWTQAGADDDIKIGGYQNARLGFTFNSFFGKPREQMQGIWAARRPALQELVDAGKVSAATYEAASALFEGRAGTVTPQRIAALGADEPFVDTDGRRSHAGKAILSGSEWWGVKKISRAK